jgi:hypothetical protein
MDEIANKIENKTNPKQTRYKYQTCVMKYIDEIADKIQKKVFNKKTNKGVNII